MIRTILLILLGIITSLSLKAEEQTLSIKPYTHSPMIAKARSRSLFENPYANIPAQCYIETSHGTQNACLFCHSNAPARQGLGNTLAQAGADSSVGNLQLHYAFSPSDRFTKSPNINPWENILFPQSIDRAMRKQNIRSHKWDMASYIKEDNWTPAYKNKQGVPTQSNSGIKDDAFRLFPALNPLSLPADKDGFVRTMIQKESLFRDTKGFNTGWRSINFMPYGIFSPHTGSVSAVYIRLKTLFMQNTHGVYTLDIYNKNLQLLEKAIQDRLSPNETHYLGKAKHIAIDKGLFPLGTEFVHPLHYVDTKAKRFKGLRANRIKELRYSYKYKMFYPTEVTHKEEDAPLYYQEEESWIDNGAGWYLSAFIEDSQGRLRGQTPEELLQCVGCHSSTYGFEPAQFTSGTGNTIDTVWSFSRKFSEELGWKEMDYMGYKKNPFALNNTTSGIAQRGDPINRETKIGEFRYFLNHVVGASLYGNMPKSMEDYLKKTIQKTKGYSEDFPVLNFSSVHSLKHTQTLRLALMREFTAKKDYLDMNGFIQAPLLYPTRDEALEKAKGYRKIVATQRFKQGKEYFKTTPFSLKYYRNKEDSFTHIDDKTPYRFGEVITDRPYNHSKSREEGIGIVPTLIQEDSLNYDAEYLPILLYPQKFEETK